MKKQKPRIRSPVKATRRTSCTETPPEEVEIIARIEESKKQVESLAQTFLEMPFKKDDKVQSLIHFILNNEIRTRCDIYYLSHYLSSFPSFINILSPGKEKYDKSVMLFKVAKYIKEEILHKNDILFRVNDLGDKFYLVIKGQVSILIKNEIVENITKEQYISYLTTLWELEEKYLFFQATETNAIQSSKWDIDLNFIESLPINKEKYKIKSLEDFLRILSSSFKILSKEGDKKEKITIFGYHHVCDINVGQTFGELALRVHSVKRTATVYCSESVTLCSLSKKLYDVSFKETNEKLRWRNIYYLLNYEILNGINIGLFETKYFNCFTQITLKRGDYLAKQKDKRENVYFLQSGEVELEAKLSFRKIEEIIKSLGGVIKPEHGIENALFNRNVFNKFLKSKNMNCRLFVIHPGDVIGLDDYLLEGVFFSNVICASETAQLFSINANFLFDMIRKTPKILPKLESFINKKKTLMMTRLNDIRKVTLTNNKKRIMSKIDYINSEEEKKRNTCVYSSPNSPHCKGLYKQEKKSSLPKKVIPKKKKNLRLENELFSSPEKKRTFSGVPTETRDNSSYYRSSLGRTFNYPSKTLTTSQFNSSLTQTNTVHVQTCSNINTSDIMTSKFVLNHSEKKRKIPLYLFGVNENAPRTAKSIQKEIRSMILDKASERAFRTNRNTPSTIDFSAFSRAAEPYENLVKERYSSSLSKEKIKKRALRFLLIKPSSKAKPKKLNLKSKG